MKAILFADDPVLFVNSKDELRRDMFKLSKIRETYNFMISTNKLGSGISGNESN
jgi:hypothetical protein